MQSRVLCAALLGAAALPVAASTVFPVSNQATLARSAALPTLGETGVPDAGHEVWRLSLDWTNEYDAATANGEALTLDGETQRIGFGWRRGFAGGWSLEAELPVLVTGGGVLDSTIESWHQFWGLPNGGRENAPQNRYLFQYQRNGQTLLGVDQGTTGLGDAQLGASLALNPALALHAMAKLPTGSASKLTGGNAGGAVWADYDPFSGSRRWFGFVSGGGSYNAHNGPLGAQQHAAVGLAGAGVGFRLTPPFALLMQVYGHTPLYKDSSIDALRRGGLQLAFGAGYQLTPSLALTLGFQEDPIVASSPDFSIHVDARWD